MRPSPDDRARKSEEGLKEVRRSRMGARAGAMARERRMVVAAADGRKRAEKKGLCGGGGGTAAGEGFGRAPLWSIWGGHDPGRLE
jgi:hypothetical protein